MTNRSPTCGGTRPVVPADPCFSLSALTFGPGSLKSDKAARFHFFWARNAIFHGLRALGVQPGQKILVPAFICAAAIEPMEHFGAKIGFYATQRNCAPDWTDLESKIQGDVRAILAIHYFGFPCDIARFRALCDRYNLFLIEDCAHVLEGVPSPHKIGEFGEFSVFSPRKYLPVFDGGTLRLNRASPDFRVRLQFETPLFTLRVAKNLFDRRKASNAPLHVERSPTPQPEEGRTQRELDIVQGLPRKPFYVTPDSTSFLPWMANVPMSRLSKHLIPYFPIEEIASKRRANYSYLLERVSQLEGVQPLFKSLPADVVPWVLPLTIGERHEMDIALRALGIPAVTWVSVRDPRISAQEFPEADFLYECLILLPVHQDLERPQLDLIAEAVTSVCQNGSGRKETSTANG